MGRPSKLTPAQWEEIKARVLAGEAASDLAREFGVSRASVSKHVSKQIGNVKVVANQLVAADDALRAMPVSQQLLTLKLADELRAISMHLAGAAKYGAATAHRLAGVAHGLVQNIDDAKPLESMESMKAVAILSKIGNDAAHVGLNLLAANKGAAFIEPADIPKTLPANVIDAAAAYARVMGA